MLSKPSILPGGDGERAPFMAFAADQITYASLVKVAGEQGWPENWVLEGGISEAITALGGVATPQVLVLDISDSADPIADISALAEVCDEGTRVIALGQINDVNLYRELMDFGVLDYLLKPVSPEAMGALILKAIEQPEIVEEENKTGRLIAVIGARGGVGASMVAVNTAWMIAHEQNIRVALVDLDLYFGSVALSLDLEPGRGFREALENPSRIDGLFIERAMVRESDHLFVLGAEEPLENRISFDSAAVELLLERLRASFDCVVVDLPRSEVTAHSSILAQASMIGIVSDATLASMRDTMRLKEFAKKSAPAADAIVIVNRFGAAKIGELSKGDFERGAELTVDYLIPYEIKTAAQSMNSGKALGQVAKNGKLVALLRDLSRQFSGSDEEITKPHIWDRLLKRGE
jgi:pilus assembly protein CpaE